MGNCVAGRQTELGASCHVQGVRWRSSQLGPVAGHVGPVDVELREGDAVVVHLSDVLPFVVLDAIVCKGEEVVLD